MRSLDIPSYWCPKLHWGLFVGYFVGCPCIRICLFFLRYNWGYFKLNSMRKLQSPVQPILRKWCRQTPSPEGRLGYINYLNFFLSGALSFSIHLFIYIILNLLFILGAIHQHYFSLTLLLRLFQPCSPLDKDFQLAAVSFDSHQGGFL